MATESAIDPVDLAYLHDLLSLLRDNDVSAFAAGGLSVAFKQSPEPNYEAHVPFAGRTKEQTIDNEDASTSSRPVAGFRDGWKNPSLWPAQGGKILKFDGTLE